MDNKLGLKIVRIKDGYTDLFEINGDQIWTKNVWDIRKDLENIDNLDGSSAVLMLTSVDTGHILTVTNLIEGRITDCISAWIYVPASINIAGKELVEIVDAIKKDILANELNDEKLTQLLSKSYESAPATRITAKSNGEKCAYRYYGQGAKYTLSELLKDMCQSYYKAYKSVFLLDNSSKLKCLQGDNLSDQKVYSMLVVKSPGNIDSFVPYIGEQPFVGQMYTIEGGTIDIEWRRDGYMPIHTKSTIAPGVKYSVPTPNQYVRVLNYDYIKVVDEWDQRVTDYDLYVAKQRISKNEDIRINEATLNNVWVEIHAEGFEPISSHVNLTQPILLKLVKETYAYEFLLPLKNEEGYYPIKISGNRKMKNSPVKGYVTENGYVTRNNKNYLRFKPFTRKFWITSLICSIIVLLLSFCGGYALNDFIGGKVDNKEVSQLTKENAELKSRIKELEKRNYNYTPKGATNNNEDYSLDAAISYLDNNNKWNRTEMEKFDDLKGLWDALNERLFDDIIKYEAKLKQSVTFLEVLQAVKANKHKKFAQPYSNDYDIRIHPEQGVSNGYINALNVVQASSSSKKGGAKPKKQEEVKKDNKPKTQGDW
ncbi:hypothetical protein [Bacteroides acidifaciens]|uniref:hypothetical protein n=1 Tax=Bacteroides acidifaciens TaxID=85831 RepID=UPI0026ECE657|nr:hypothetical protein [Bacteroides acidifaciens]